MNRDYALQPRRDGGGERVGGGGGKDGFCNHSRLGCLSLSPDEQTPKTGYVAIQRAAPPNTVQPSMISPLSLYFDRISQLILLLRLGPVLARNRLQPLAYAVSFIPPQTCLFQSLKMTKNKETVWKLPTQPHPSVLSAFNCRV